MKKVICVGNRYLYPDSSAIDVFDYALKKADNFVEWIEGGLGGLNLLEHFENVKEVLILDYMPNYTHAKVYPLNEILDTAPYDSYHHESALYYLLKSLHVVLERVPNVEVMACNVSEQDSLNQVYDSVKQWSQNV